MRRGEMRITNLNQIVNFQSRGIEDDGHGNKVADFVERFREWGRLQTLKGGEGVFEARLSARQPAILTVRAIGAVAQVEPDWIASIDGDDWNIMESPRRTDDRQYFEMLVERGGVGG